MTTVNEPTSMTIPEGASVFSIGVQEGDIRAYAHRFSSCGKHRWMWTMHDADGCTLGRGSYATAEEALAAAMEQARERVQS